MPLCLVTFFVAPDPTTIMLGTLTKGYGMILVAPIPRLFSGTQTVKTCPSGANQKVDTNKVGSHVVRNGDRDPWLAVRILPNGSSDSDKAL